MTKPELTSDQKKARIQKLIAGFERHCAAMGHEWEPSIFGGHYCRACGAASFAPKAVA